MNWSRDKNSSEEKAVNGEIYCMLSLQHRLQSLQFLQPGGRRQTFLMLQIANSATRLQKKQKTNRMRNQNLEIPASVWDLTFAVIGKTFKSSGWTIWEEKTDDFPWSYWPYIFIYIQSIGRLLQAVQSLPSARDVSTDPIDTVMIRWWYRHSWYS